MRFVKLLFIMFSSLVSASCAHHSTAGEAAVGGGLGGALGGAVGAEVGGRTGAIIGSAAGAAAGAAIATEDYDKSGGRDRYHDHRGDYDDDHYRYPKRHYGRKHCPPGLAMQGRC